VHSNINIYHELNKIIVILNAVANMLFGSWPRALVQQYVWTPQTCPRPIQRFHQKFTKVSLTSKLCYWSTSKLCYWCTSKLCYCYWSTSKLCIFTDYMVAFGNSARMYYIEKLNNGEYPPNRKCLSVKYSFKCAKQPLGSLHWEY
jgi:hypothetical protein